MDFIKRTNELEVHVGNRVIKLKGHQDNDAFSLFTESVETYLYSSQEEKSLLLDEIKKRNDIVIR